MLVKEYILHNVIAPPAGITDLIKTQRRRDHELSLAEAQTRLQQAIGEIARLKALLEQER